MFDRIIYISDDSCQIKLREDVEITTNLMNLHLVFEDDVKTVLGEVDNLEGGIVKARFLGEIVGNRLIGGTIRKPSLDAQIRVIDTSEIPLITGSDETGYMELGVCPFYDDFPVYLDVNSFFSNHFAIFGNTGSGKSCGTTRLFQNMFHDKKLNPYKANIFIFDSSGEYYNAFSNLSQINPQYNYRYISTNETDNIGEKLRLPIYLLNRDDLALLLQCTSHSQLPIIERMLKLALVFSQNDIDSSSYKNHLIAKAIMTILYTNETAPNKRNEIFSILASCSTDEFNLEAPIQGIGYVRKFRECFLIDNSGNFTESVLMNEYLESFIKEEYDDFEPHTGVFYDLNTLEKALNFTLISEGWLRNEQTYGDSVTIRVRLHSLIVGENAKYFDVKEYVSLEKFLSSLLIVNGKKYQIVNINLNDIDDEFAKVLTKIYSRLIFDFSKSLKNRGSIPFHIVLEEAHRYIQSDNDRFLFGYNIFERIAKEGRKYGVILGIITQRPVELSDNVISQCTNFLIFKINHPLDIDYMRKMIPHITEEIIEKQKSLQSGTCLGFGLGFKIPLIIKMKMPDPAPLSGNCDVVKIWCGVKTEGVAQINSASTPTAAPAPTPTAAAAPVPASTLATPAVSNLSLESSPDFKLAANEFTSPDAQMNIPSASEEVTSLNAQTSSSTNNDEMTFLNDNMNLPPSSEKVASLNEQINSSSSKDGEPVPFLIDNMNVPDDNENNSFDESLNSSLNSQGDVSSSQPGVLDSLSAPSTEDTSFPKLEEVANEKDSSTENTPSVGISEIADVQINQQGMVNSSIPTLVADNGEPLLNIVEDTSSNM